MFFISLQKLFLFLRKNKFRNLDIQISWSHFFYEKILQIWQPEN